MAVVLVVLVVDCLVGVEVEHQDHLPGEAFLGQYLPPPPQCNFVI